MGNFAAELVLFAALILDIWIKHLKVQEALNVAHCSGRGLFVFIGKEEYGLEYNKRPRWNKKKASDAIGQNPCWDGAFKNMHLAKQ